MGTCNGKKQSQSYTCACSSFQKYFNGFLGRISLFAIMIMSWHFGTLCLWLPFVYYIRFSLRALNDRDKLVLCVILVYRRHILNNKSILIHYCGRMPCLISFVWASPSCEEREVSKKFRWNKCLQRESNKRPLLCTWFVRPLGHAMFMGYVLNAYTILAFNKTNTHDVQCIY